MLKFIILFQCIYNPQQRNMDIKGDFPICEEISDTTISIPVHEFINEKQMNFVIKKIKKFFNEN